MIPVIMWAIAGLLTLFAGCCVVVFVREVLRLRGARLAGPRRSLSQRIDAYVGPIDRSRAPLNPGLRVAAEFFTALLGFPGIGWMVSGRIKVGLPLMVLVPAALWMFYPLYISYAGVVLDRPLEVLAVLPPIAVTSAGALAMLELRRAAAR